MTRSIKKFLWLFILFPAYGLAQQSEVLSLDEIIKRIDNNNLQLKSFGIRADAFVYSADAATAWMPPMVGLGIWQTPYPFQKITDERDKGMLMLRVEQEIPSHSKLQARKNYILSQGNIEKATRALVFNTLRTQARQQYFTWLVAIRRINIIQKNEQILETVKKIEEVRYPYNQSQLSSVYRAEAEIQKNKAMLIMPQGEIAKAKAYLNGLMNRTGDTEFNIDISYQPAFEDISVYDTASLALLRKDIQRMNESLVSMQFNIEAMKLERKPSFRVQFDHMSPFSSMMPKAFSVMGMISIPIAPWSKKMYESGVKSMQLNVDAMKTERAAMLQETQAMIYGMLAEIKTMQKRIKAMEEKVIPALQKTFDASYISYQENKLSLTVVLDNWEALNMILFDVLDEKQKLYQMFVDYGKELYR